MAVLAGESHVHAEWIGAARGGPHLGDKRQTPVGMTKALRGLRAAIDVVPTDPDEIARRGETPGDVLRSALREGKTVYERDA